MTKFASLKAPGCAVEDGEYGDRLVPAGRWNERHVKFMSAHGLNEIHFNRERGFASDGDYRFLEQVPKDLLGLKIIDHEATNLAPCQTLASTLKSLDLSFVGKFRQPMAFDRFVKLERLRILVPVPGAESLFQCPRLERLALSRYSGKLSRDLFANLRTLKMLFLSSVKLEDFGALRDLLLLEELTVAAAKGLHSLSGIEGMHQLRSLTIESSRRLGSLQPIEGLAGVERLWLYNCGPIDTLKPLEKLTELREITLNGNTRVVDGDLSILNALPHLKTVCVVDRLHYQPRAASVNRSA